MATTWYRTIGNFMTKNEDLVDQLNRIFALDPLSPAVEQAGQYLSFGQIHTFVEQMDAQLTAAGYGCSTPVGLLLRNRSECLAAALGIIWTRRCLVTVNPMLPPQALKRDLQSLGVPVLLAWRGDWENPVFLDAAKDVGALGLEVARDKGNLSLNEILAVRAGARFRPFTTGTAIEMLTSGTTGPPKRIKLDFDSLSSSLRTGSKYESGGAAIALHKSPSILWMPLAHIGGLWNALYQFYNGRRIVLFERFSIEQWHDAIKRYQLRFATFPPSQLGQLMENDFPKEDFASLLAIRCGAAPLDHELAQRFEERYGVPVLEAYGATEFAGGVAGWTIKDHRTFAKTKRASVGRANPGVELRIVDPLEFAPVPANTEGLLEVRSSQIDKGKTWARTTDRAKLDEDGFLYILGRADNAINRGGFKIMPDQVEAALRTHPAIAEVCVVGVDDERLGQVPVAAYEVKAGAIEPSPDTLKSFLADMIKPYEIPTRFLAVRTLPRTLSLKVSQLAVRELFEPRPQV